jgi:hypothetical protein
LDPLPTQLLWLLTLAIPVACIAWTVTHEEVLREPREYCKDQSQVARGIWRRKFFYLFTCEYCLSHYVAALFLLIIRFHLLYPDWRGYLVSWFALVWVSNVYMAGFARLHLDVHHERLEIKSKDIDLKSKAESLGSNRAT